MIKDTDLLIYGVKKGQIPQYLYKYRTIESGIKILENPALFFPSYDVLNDPFECFASITANATPEQWYKYLIRQGLDPVLALPKAAEIASQPQRQIEIVNRSIENTKLTLGILCLSSSPIITSMWEHYGDHYKGVCIEFDILKDPDAFLFPKMVEYSEDVKQFNYIESQITQSGTIVVDPLFHKTNDWAYEKEYRIVKLAKANTLIPISPQAISTIIFGKDTDPAQIARFKNIAQAKGFNSIQFKQAVRTPSSPKLQLITV